MLKRIVIVSCAMLALAFVVHLGVATMASCTAPSGTDQCEVCCSSSACKGCCAFFTNPRKNQRCRAFCGKDGTELPPDDDDPAS